MGQLKGIEFGFMYHGDPSEPTVDYDCNLEEQLFQEAIPHACPAREAVMKKLGPEWTLERYVSCDVVMKKLILERCEELNLSLLKILITPVPRLEGEPVGKYEEGAVPSSHETEMSLGSTSYGYSLPRVIIEAIGRKKSGRIGKLSYKHQKLSRIVDMIENAVTTSDNPFQLLAIIAEGSIKIGAKPNAVLGHMFAQGIIDEENCYTQYREIEQALQQYAPEVWQIYSTMSDEEKSANNMWMSEQR